MCNKVRSKVRLDVFWGFSNNLYIQPRHPVMFGVFQKLLASQSLSFALIRNHPLQNFFPSQALCSKAMISFLATANIGNHHFRASCVLRRRCLIILWLLYGTTLLLQTGSFGEKCPALSPRLHKCDSMSPGSLKWFSINENQN